MSLSYPFVNFKLNTVANVIYWQSNILDLSLNTCVVDSLYINNASSLDTVIDIYVASQNPNTGNISYLSFLKQQPLKINEHIELFKGSCIYINPGSYLVANSNNAQQEINSFLSYRELITTPTTTAMQINSLIANQTSGVVTATTGTNHNLTSGKIILVTGAIPHEYNGFYSVTVISATQFTYQISNSNIPPVPNTGQVFFTTYA